MTFCIFLGIFRHVQKNRVLFGETPKKKKVFAFT